MSLLPILGILAFVLVIVFLLSSVLFGAPYLPTMAVTSAQLFKQVSLPRGSTFYDLGCGDGRMLQAAREHGYKAVGYETNPMLWLLCKWRFRRDKHTRIKFGNFLKADLSQADLVYVFGVSSVVNKLENNALKNLPRGSWLVLNGYRLPKRKPSKAAAGLIYYKF